MASAWEGLRASDQSRAQLNVSGDPAYPLAEALTADVEAVLADETGAVGADAAVRQDKAVSSRKASSRSNGDNPGRHGISAGP